jgi:hypothetical protein
VFHQSTKMKHVPKIFLSIASEEDLSEYNSIIIKRAQIQDFDFDHEYSTKTILTLKELYRTHILLDNVKLKNDFDPKLFELDLMVDIEKDHPFAMMLQQKKSTKNKS